jgi:dihydrodipicolinate synthase/N-acetylneuraminate lyase
MNVSNIYALKNVSKNIRNYTEYIRLSKDILKYSSFHHHAANIVFKSASLEPFGNQMTDA